MRTTTKTTASLNGIGTLACLLQGLWLYLQDNTFAKDSLSTWLGPGTFQNQFAKLFSSLLFSLPREVAEEAEGCHHPIPALLSMQSLKQAFQSQYFRENWVKPQKTSRNSKFRTDIVMQNTFHTSEGLLAGTKETADLCPAQTCFPAKPSGPVGGKGADSWSCKEDSAVPNFCQMGMSDPILLDNG